MATNFDSTTIPKEQIRRAQEHTKSITRGEMLKRFRDEDIKCDTDVSKMSIEELKIFLEDIVQKVGSKADIVKRLEKNGVEITPEIKNLNRDTLGILEVVSKTKVKKG